MFGLQACLVIGPSAILLSSSFFFPPICHVSEDLCKKTCVVTERNQTLLVGEGIQKLYAYLIGEIRSGGVSWRRRGYGTQGRQNRVSGSARQRRRVSHGGVQISNLKTDLINLRSLKSESATQQFDGTAWNFELVYLSNLTRGSSPLIQCLRRAAHQIPVCAFAASSHNVKRPPFVHHAPRCLISPLATGARTVRARTPYYIGFTVVKKTAVAFRVLK